MDTSCPLQAAEQSEPQYANLQLHTWSLQEEPMPPRQVEVEYSTVVSVKPGSLAHGPWAMWGHHMEGWAREGREGLDPGWPHRRPGKWRFSPSGGP